MSIWNRFKREPTQQEQEEQAVHDLLTDDKFELI